MRPVLAVILPVLMVLCALCPPPIFGQERVRVVIVNAKGAAGEAEALGEQLSREVFEIVKIARSRKKADSPLIFVKAPYRKQARQVADTLTIKPTWRRFQKDHDADMIVVLPPGSVRGKKPEQTQNLKRFSVLLNPAATVLGWVGSGPALQIDAGAAITPAHRISLGPVYSLVKSGPVKGDSVGTSLGYRWHPFSGWAGGLFAGPALEATRYALKDSGTKKSVTRTGFGFGILGGYGWTWSGGFTLVAGVGSTYLTLNRLEVGDSEFELPPVMARLLLEIGYSF